MSALQDHLIETTAPEETEGFRIEDTDAANWAVRKLAKADAEIRDNAKQAEREIERVNAWLEDACRSAVETYERMQMLLEDYHRRLLEADPQRKTVKLPAGTLSARKLPDNIEISDEKTFIEKMRVARKEFVRTKYEIARQAVKDAVLKDGEIVEGVERVEGAISFKVEVQHTVQDSQRGDAK